MREEIEKEEKKGRNSSDKKKEKGRSNKDGKYWESGI